MAGSRRSWKKILLWTAGIAVVLFIAIQLVPYGRSSHSNPAATSPFRWTDPQAETIARGSCYDCHSNETKWWWATNIAPFSWLVQRDVDEGRAHLNFSEHDGLPPLEEFQEVVNEGEMPPIQYTLIHPGAKLSDAEKQALIQGYQGGMAATGVSGGAQPAPQATSTSSPAANPDALAIIEQRCSTCHQAEQALGYHAGSAEEARALIGQMKQRGAEVTPEEEQILIQYFTR
jgi:hypothetical protein